MAYYTPAAREFLSEVAQAYHNSPGEVAVTVGLIGALLFGLSGYLVVQGRRSARREREWSADEFRRILRAREVPPSGEDALERIAEAWGKPHRKHRVVQDAAVFDRAARRALKEGTVRPETVSALRVTLGIVHRNDQVPKSTTELAVDAKVRLRSREGKVVGGRISAQHPAGFSVAVGAGASRFAAGRPVELLMKTTGGVFRVRTFSQGFEEGPVHLRHREEIRHTQQRRHFRRSLNAQARIVRSDERRSSGATAARQEPEGPPETPDPADQSAGSAWVRLHDLGGGGASFTDPFRNGGSPLTEGDRVLVALPGIGRSGGDLSIPAEIVRLSEGESGERRCHVAFAEIPEGDRDRIYRLLFAAERRA
jgi:hypothetical protein